MKTFFMEPDLRNSPLSLQISGCAPAPIYAKVWSAEEILFAVNLVMPCLIKSSPAVRNI